MIISHGFSASWYAPPDGPSGRPATSKEARAGAGHEWSKLMIEPPNKWSNPLITPHTDEYDRQRGTMNLKVACNAPSDSDLRIIAKAYMGLPDSEYCIVYWSPPIDVKRLTTSSIQIKDHIIEKHGNAWEVTSPPSSWLLWRSHFHLRKQPGAVGRHSMVTNAH